ncbi:MAG: hypothetical protein ACYC8V_07975 [Caulobacteraceae bacterium]
MRTPVLAACLAALLFLLAAHTLLAQTAQLQTPGAYGHSNVEHAAIAPLHDLNIARQRIPAVLLAAMADPYARVPHSCRAIRIRVADLDGALGPDFDEPGQPVDPSLRGRAGPMALSLMHGASENLLPFHGFVSTLSGAERHDALILQAINAGSVRRGYLKGLGESHGCRPPDAPRHLAYTPPPVQERRTRPLYPIH